MARRQYRRRWTPPQPVTAAGRADLAALQAGARDLGKLGHRAHYDSFSAWTDAAAGEPVAGARGPASSRSHPPSETWDYNTGLDRAFELARQGWPEGLARVEEIRAHTAAAVDRELTRPGWSFDVAGAVPDVARFLAGDPENMLTPCNEPAPARVVRVVVNISASCRVDAGALYARGAAAVALVDALESCGIRCEVWSAHCCHGEHSYAVDTVQIKGAEDHADRDRLAFALCHPANLRRLYFAVAENTYTNPTEYSIGEGYGKPADVDGAARGDIYFPAAKGWESQWSTPENAARWILEQLRAQGVELEPQTPKE